MKLKEKLIIEVVVELYGFDIPLTQVLEFIDVISTSNVICFEPHEKDLMDALLVNNVIQEHSDYSHQYASSKFIDLTFTYGENYKEFEEELYYLYNKMDRKKLSRERKLKELSNESV